MSDQKSGPELNERKPHLSRFGRQDRIRLLDGNICKTSPSIGGGQKILK